MINSQVYQSEPYVSAKINSPNLLSIGENFSTEIKTIFFFYQKKKILEARGTPSEADLKKFKKTSKKYFYGTVAPCVLDPKEKIFKKLGFKKISNYTILIDLKKSEDDLWKNLEKKSIRWGVNFARKNDLSFVLAKPSETSAFYKIYKKTAAEGKFSPETIKFISTLRDTLISKLFLVKSKTKIVAGGLILLDKKNNYSILDLTASSSEGLKLQAMPFLYWNLILFSKSLNLNYFDLGGYDKEAKTGEKTHNINKFKERFGGEITEQPIFSTNWKYPFFRSILRTFKFLKKMYKK